MYKSDCYLQVWLRNYTVYKTDCIFLRKDTCALLLARGDDTARLVYLDVLLEITNRQWTRQQEQGITAGIITRFVKKN